MRLILADCTVSTHQKLKIYIEALTGFSHMFFADGLSNTLPLSKLHPWNGSCYGNSVQSVYFKDRGRSEEPLITWVQIEGELAVTSSWYDLTEAY